MSVSTTVQDVSILSFWRIALCVEFYIIYRVKKFKWISWITSYRILFNQIKSFDVSFNSYSIQFICWWIYPELSYSEWIWKCAYIGVRFDFFFGLSVLFLKTPVVILYYKSSPFMQCLTKQTDQLYERKGKTAI